jgi:predicted transcriptional regulator
MPCGRVNLRIKILRRLSLEEVKKRLHEHETVAGMSFPEFEKRFIERKIDVGLFGEYVEWANLLHAYEAYVEGGELDYMVEETLKIRSDELDKILNSRRLELLETISKSHVESINDVARKVRRNVKNVYNDLKLLEKRGLLHLRKVGKRNIIPETLIEEFSIVIQ